MKKNFYKITMLIQVLLITVVSVYFLINEPPAREHIIRIPYIHPFEFYFVLELGGILLIISAVVAFLIGLFVNSKSKDKGLSQEVVEKRVRKEKFWKLTCYGNLIISMLIVALGVFIYITAPFEMILYYPYRFNDYLLPVLISQFVASFFVGALLLSSNLLWNQNKALGIVTLIFGFVLAFIPLILGVKLQMECHYENEARSYAGYIEEVLTEVTATEEAEDEYGDTGEEYEESGDEYYFSFSDLWNEPSNDEENVRSAITEVATGLLFENGKNTINKLRYYSEFYAVNKKFSEKEGSKGYGYFRKISAKIARNPDVMREAFNAYKDVLYEVVSVKSYTKNEVDSFIEILLLAYYDIYSDENPENTLNAIFTVMETNSRNGVEYINYSAIKPFISDKTESKMDEFVFNDESKLYNADKIWAYSFWARRKKEGNTQVVLDILNEIKKHYDQ
ncbi:hypothetical protein ACFSX9_10865 [Flavobacterium ardleyense]|uniref:Uncharacterized protein n=1 Tax=Flavobacterium ardleyense TaxID=2038737 RepID=A0ABW5ZBS1_9FLAO